MVLEEKKLTVTPLKPNGVFEEPGPKEPVSLVPSVILVPKPRKTKRRIRLGTDIGSFGWFLRSEPMYIWPDSIRLLTEGTSEGTAHYFPIWDEGARRRDAWLRGKWHAVPLEPSSRRSTTTFEGGVSARGSARGSTPPRTDATAHRARVDDMWRRAPCFANSTWTGKSRRGHAVGAALVSFPYLMVVVQRGAAGHCNTRVCWWSAGVPRRCRRRDLCPPLPLSRADADAAAPLHCEPAQRRQVAMVVRCSVALLDIATRGCAGGLLACLAGAGVATFAHLSLSRVLMPTQPLLSL